MARLYIRLLGGFEVRLDGAAIPDSAWRRRTAKSLMKLLALEHGHRLHRERVVDLLWPTASPESGSNNLGKALHAARQALEHHHPFGHSSFLHLRDEVLILAPNAGSQDRLTIDVEEFVRLARPALEAKDGSQLERALAAYTGQLLPEDCYEAWTHGERERLAGLHRDLLLRLSEVWEAAGDPRVRFGYTDLLELDPALEAAHRGLMRIALASGDIAAVLHQYDACARALAADLEIAPSADTFALYEKARSLVQRQDPRAGGAWRRASSLPSTHARPFASGAGGLRQVREPLPPEIEGSWQLPFVGRRATLDLLSHRLATAGDSDDRDATPTLLLVAGEAGVGKTRLIAEACRTSAAEGQIVLWGTAREREGAPFSPVVEALDRRISALAQAERIRLARRFPRLIRLLTALSEPAPRVHYDPTAPSHGADGAHPSNRRPLFAQLVGLLDELASGRRMVFVLDDLHHAEPDTLKLVAHLMRAAVEPPSSGGRRRWLILGAFRDDEAQRDLLALTTAGERERLVGRLDLSRLSRPESDDLVRSFIAAHDGAGSRSSSPAVERNQPPTEGREPRVNGRLEVSDEVFEFVHRVALGNALFVNEVTRLLVERGDLVLLEGRCSLAPGADLERHIVPSGVGELIEQRMMTVPFDVQRLAALAAVAGSDASFEILQAAAGSVFGRTPSDGRLLKALDGALERRILVPREGTYGFRHPLLAAAHYERTSPERRARMHRSAARALEHLHPRRFESIAFHHTLAGDEERAWPFRELAGDRAQSLGSHDSAIRHYQAVVAILDRLGQDLRSIAVRQKLAASLAASGKYEDARGELGQALSLVHRHEDEAPAYREHRIRLVAQLGRVHGALGRPRVGIHVIGRELARYESLHGASAVHAELLSALTRLHFFNGSARAAAESAQRALELVGREPNGHGSGGLGTAGPAATEIQAESLGALGVANLVLGRPRRAIRALHEAVERARGLGDDRLLAMTASDLGLAYRLVLELEESGEWLQQAEQAAERAGDLEQQLFVLCARSDHADLVGNWAEARRLVEGVRQSVQPLGDAPVMAYVLLSTGMHQFHEGEWDAARRSLEQSEAVGRRVGDVNAGKAACSLLAELDRRCGCPELALERIDELMEGAGSNRTRLGRELATITARALADLGRVDEATRLVEASIRRRRRGGSRLWLALDLRDRLVLASRTGDWETAEACAREGLRLVRPVPYEEALFLLERGRMRRARVQTGQARDDLTAAARIFERLGARKDLEDARTDLAELGHRADAAGWPNSPAR